MPVLNKNVVDGPPAITVDMLPNAPPSQPLASPRWYQSEWTTDQQLFVNPAGRTAQNFWTAGTFLSQVRKFTVALPGPLWNAFAASSRHIYFRVGSGTTSNITSSWVWSAITDIIVNHMPDADAGTARSISLAANGTVAADIILDGTQSGDPDAGSTLSYTWKLKSPPPSCFDQAFLSALRSRLSANSAQVTAFPTGTPITLASEGTYVFTLEVKDDDPPSFRRNTIGRDEAEVRITLGSALLQIRIDAPTSAASARRTRPDPIDVEIAWRMDPALHQQLQTSYPGNHRLRLSIVESGASVLASPVFTDVQVPVPQQGMFIWNGIDSNGVPVASGTFDLHLSLVDAMDVPVAVSGFTTTTLEAGAVVIDAFSARIDRRISPTFVAFGTPAFVIYEVTAPQTPDAMELVVEDAIGAVTRTTLATPAGAAAVAAPLPGRYLCTIEVKRLAQVVASSETHEMWVIDDPLAPSVGVFAVGRTLYNAGTDSMAPVATRTLTLPADPVDGINSAIAVGIHALVRYPASAAGDNQPVSPLRPSYPLVLIVHGNFNQQPPAAGSFLGFDYLATHLAAQGFIAASLEMEALQGVGISGIDHRARVINAHLARWVWENAADPMFQGRVDLNQVGLVCHSRGGEAVVRAVSLGLPAGTAVRAVTSISATDIWGHVPALGCPYLCLYGSADGDIYLGMPFRLYDRADRPKAQVFLYGATHNDFCDHALWTTERRESAPSRILPRSIVQNAARAFVAAFLQWHLRGRTEMAWHFDPQVMPLALKLVWPQLVTVKSLELAPTMIVDRFLTPPIAATDTGLVTRAAPLGTLVPFVEQSFRFTDSPVVAYDTPHVQQNTSGGYVGWSTPGSAYVVDLADKDVSLFRVLTFRIAQALLSGTPPADPRNPLNTAKNFRVGLTDTSGRLAAVDLAGFLQALPYPYVRNDEPVPGHVGPTPSAAEFGTKSAFTSVRLPLWAFKAAAPKLDLTHLANLRLMLDGTGLVVIDNIEFSP
jgi:hypothetical protein